MTAGRRREPVYRWCVEYRAGIREPDQLTAFRTLEMAQAECDNLNTNHAEFGNEYVVVRYRRVPSPKRKGGK